MVKYNMFVLYAERQFTKLVYLELNGNQTKSEPNKLHNRVTIIRFTIASVVTPESVSILK